MSVDDALNLDALQQLKSVFEAADEDGSGELDIDEFCDKIGPHLGANLTRTQVAQLFMKIDADAGGTVDWDEFTNFMFLERAQTLGEGLHENWRLFPQDVKDRNDPSSFHREHVSKLHYMPGVDKYLTCGNDGTFRLWNAADLRHFKTVHNSGSWVTDALFLPAARRLVLSTMDRAISYYDINRGSYDLVGRVYASGNMGVPLCLASLQMAGVAEEVVVYGDSKSNVHMLLCDHRELPPRDLISTDDHRDYLLLHRDHTEWITQLQHVPEVGLVSSSLDGTIRCYDVGREKTSVICSHHARTCNGFVWCRAYSLFASCGIERDILVWQAHTGRLIGTLTGHTASVTHVALDERLNQVFSMSADHVVKVWDLRNHKCLQTLAEPEWSRTGDSKPTAMAYDNNRRRLVTAATRPTIWAHKMVAQDRTGHKEPVRAVAYNDTFKIAVTADEGGTICCWNIADGSREGRFSEAHGSSKLSAMCFDRNQRRLLTAANDGSVRMWNFNNGSLLREYVHAEEPLEVTAVLFAADEQRESDTVYAAGWNARIFVWEDRDENVVNEYKSFEGHREDILDIAACPQKQLLASGDYEGRIYIWNLFSGQKRMWMCHRADRYEVSCEKLLWLQPKGAGSKQEGPLLLLSCGGDGWIRVWHITQSAHLVCTLRAAQGRLDQVSAVCAPEDGGAVIVGDTSGHLRVWDLANGVDVSTAERCTACFQQVGHWRAHDLTITGLDVVRGQRLLLASSRDTNVSIWTWDGCLVGVLGLHTFVLGDPTTWQDPTGASRREPMGEADSLYLHAGTQSQDGEAKEEKGQKANEGLLAELLLETQRQRLLEGRNKATPTPQQYAQLQIHDLKEVPADVRALYNGNRGGEQQTTVGLSRTKPAITGKAGQLGTTTRGD